MAKEENLLELLDLYMDMVEKQDEVIYRMSHLLREYATEVRHLRNIHEFMETNERQKLDEDILEECLDEYNEMKSEIE